MPKINYENMFHIGNFSINNFSIKLNLIIIEDGKWFKAVVPYPKNYPQTFIKERYHENIFEFNSNYRDENSIKNVCKYDFENCKNFIYVTEFNIIPKILNSKLCKDEKIMLKGLGKKCFLIMIDYFKNKFGQFNIYLRSQGGIMKNYDYSHFNFETIKNHISENYPIFFNKIKNLDHNFNDLCDILSEIENNLKLTNYYMENYGFKLLFGEKSHGQYTELILIFF